MRALLELPFCSALRLLCLLACLCIARGAPFVAFSTCSGSAATSSPGQWAVGAIGLPQYAVPNSQTSTTAVVAGMFNAAQTLSSIDFTVNV